MSRRRKDRVKAAKEREAQRLAEKRGELDEYLEKKNSKKKRKPQDSNSPNASDSKNGSAADSVKDDKPRRKKDSKGKKIPTEAERRAKGDFSLSSSADKDVDASSDNKSRSSSTKIRRVSKNKPKKSAKEVFWTIAAHPFLVCLCVIVLIIAGVAIYGIIDKNSPKDDGLTSEDAKTISLIGITEPAKAVLDDTGKFDGFYVDEESGIPYADLFDYDITVEEQSLLSSRGQTLDENSMFSYNENISSAKDAKAQAEENAQSQSDAGTALSIAKQLQSEAQSNTENQ